MVQTSAFYTEYSYETQTSTIDQKECKKLLEDGKSTLDSMTDIDPSVHANYYWISSQYYKSRQEFAEFYKNSLLYLAYTSVDTLSEAFKLVC